MVKLDTLHRIVNRGLVAVIRASSDHAVRVAQARVGGRQVAYRPGATPPGEVLLALDEAA